MTTRYLVVRVGSNAANQPMTHRDPVGIFDGRGNTAAIRRADAVAQAETSGVVVYANQTLIARPSARAAREDIWAAEEAQAVRDESRKWDWRDQ